MNRFCGSDCVILSANVPHYYYAALALQSQNLLKRYICAIGLKKDDPWFLSCIPSYYRRKLQGRRIGGIRPRDATTIWLPEILQKGLPGFGLISSERGNWLNNYLYDWMASQHVDRCTVFHFVSSCGLYSAKRAKHQGAVIICDERTEHPDFQRRIVADECEALDLPYRQAQLLYDRKMKTEYEIADYMIVGSTYAKETFVRAGFEEHRIFVVPYGVDLNWFSTDGKKDGIFRIVCAGQVVPRKGIHYLLKAFSELSLPNAELLLVGKVDPTMRKLVDDYRRRVPTIRETGNVPKVELYRHYSSGSLFVLPSLADAQPLVCFEAMACSLPAIVTENMGSKEVVRDGLDGFVVPVRDVDALKEKILCLYEDEDRRKQMGESAKLRVREYTWEKYGQRLIDVYRTIFQREGIPYLNNSS